MDIPNLARSNYPRGRVAATSSREHFEQQATYSLPNRRDYMNTASVPFSACVWPGCSVLEEREVLMPDADAVAVAVAVADAEECVSKKENSLGGKKNKQKRRDENRRKRFLMAKDKLDSEKVEKEKDKRSKCQMQCLTFLAKYKNHSFEELRLGDYLWGRTSAPHSFTLFPKLPSEIRGIIWEFCCFPRTVELRFGWPLMRSRSPTPCPVVLHVSQESRAIALKNYELAFHVEPLYLDDDYNALPDEYQDTHPPDIYFNFAADTLSLTWLRTPHCLREEFPSRHTPFDSQVLFFADKLDPHEMDRVRFLAMDLDLFDYCWRRWFEFNRDHNSLMIRGTPTIFRDISSGFDVIGYFKNLETFSLVLPLGLREHFWSRNPPCLHRSCEFKFEGWPEVDMTFIHLGDDARPLGRDIHACYSKTLQFLGKRNNRDFHVPKLKYIEKYCVAIGVDLRGAEEDMSLQELNDILDRLPSGDVAGYFDKFCGL